MFASKEQWMEAFEMLGVRRKAHKEGLMTVVASHLKVKTFSREPLTNRNF